MKRGYSIRRIILFSILIIFLILAGVVQYFISEHYYRDYSKWLLLLAVCGVAISLRKGTEDRWIASEHDRERVYKPSLIVKITAALILIAGSALLFISSWHLTVSWSATYYRSFAFLAGGLILACLGLDHLFGYRVRYRSMTPAQKKWEIILFAVVMATAIFMRTYRIDYYPPPDAFGAIEEVQQGCAAYIMLYMGVKPWEFLFSDLVTTLSFKLFGISSYTLRIPPIVLSCLTIGIFYFFSRTLVGWRFAAFASFLFAVSHCHMGFSRIAHNVFLPAAPVLLCLYLMFRTVVSTRLSLYLAIGCLSGLLMYEYAPYRTMPVLVAIFFTERWVRSFAVFKRHTRVISGLSVWRLLFQNIHKPVLLILGLLVPLFPLLGRIENMPPGAYFEAAGRAIKSDPYWYDTSNMDRFLKLRLDRIRDASRMISLNWTACSMPGEPMLDPLVAITVILGGGFCTLTFLRERHTFLVIVLYITMLMGFVFPHNLDGVRMITLIPLLYTLLCLFAFWLWQFFCMKGGRMTRICFYAGMIAMCVGSFRYNYDFFFGKLISDPAVRRTFRNEYTAMISLIHRIPEHSFAIIVTRHIENFFHPCDFEWLRGHEVAGAVINQPAVAIALSHIISETSAVTIISHNHEYDIDNIITRVKNEFPDVEEKWVSMDLMNGEWRWAVLNIPMIRKGEANDVQRLEGYARIIGKAESVNRGSFTTWMKTWRVSGEGRTLSWRTEEAAESKETEYLFTGASDSAEGSTEALLSVNGDAVLTFEIGDDLPPTRWEADGYILDAVPLKWFRGSTVFYRLTVPEDDIEPGEATELSVTITGGGRDAWFSLYDQNDCWDFYAKRWRGFGERDN